MALTTLLSFVLPSFRTELFGLIKAVPVVRMLLSALLGSTLDEDIAAQALAVLPWVHPVVLLTGFAHAITLCTRVPVGEIDRGTIDFLLGLPVSRRATYLCQSLVWALSGATLILLGVVGFVVGSALAEVPLPSAGRLLITVCNGYLLCLSTGAVTCIFSCASARRGRAIGASLTVVVLSFAISFVAPFWPPIAKIEFLSLLNYYRPFAVLQEDTWPWSDLAVLFGVTAMALGIGGWIFERRDIRTV
jgi:ABC-type transport system involved in multi-copper enzyme maturation permease subunit